jgi:GDP-D-mannose dehydratase
MSQHIRSRASEGWAIDDRVTDGRSSYRVAVTVFAVVKGDNQLDASTKAVMAVKSAVAAAGTEEPAGVYSIQVDGNSSPFAPRGSYAVTKVHAVMDAALALANGYLWCAPTGQAYDNTAEQEQ